MPTPPPPKWSTLLWCSAYASYTLLAVWFATPTGTLSIWWAVAPFALVGLLKVVTLGTTMLLLMWLMWVYDRDWWRFP